MTTIPQQIKEKRKQLGETQASFGKRFGKSHAAVSEWESGKAEAPYAVIEFCLVRSVKYPVCEGEGLLS
jgi:transcriptional regulator with XRE-family HTH domain